MSIGLIGLQSQTQHEDCADLKGDSRLCRHEDDRRNSRRG